MTLKYMNAYMEKLRDEVYKDSAGLSDEECRAALDKRFDEERQKFENVALGAFLDEVTQHGYSPESDIVQQAQVINEDIRICAKACAEYYGMVELQGFAQMVAEHSGFDNIPLEAILKVLRTLVQPCLHGFALATLNDSLYVCHPMLSVESNELSFDEDVRQALLDYQTHLIQRHAQVLRCPIDQIIDQGPVYYYVAELDSAEALRKWIDTHLPDGKDNLTFADTVLEAIVESMRGPVNPHKILRMLEEYSLLEDDKDATYELLMLVMIFVNDIPIWENNGYSHEGLRRKIEESRFFETVSTCSWR